MCLLTPRARAACSPEARGWPKTAAACPCVVPKTETLGADARVSPQQHQDFSAKIFKSLRTVPRQTGRKNVRSLRKALCPGGLQVTATGQEEGMAQLPPAGSVLRWTRTNLPGAVLSGCKLLDCKAFSGLQAFVFQAGSLHTHLCLCRVLTVMSN